MSGKQVNRTQLFLIELIIVILFFSLAGGISFQVFASAKATQNQATNLNQAVFVTQSYAETLVALSPEAFGQWLDSVKTQEGYGEVVYYDENWQMITPESSVDRVTFRLICEIQPDGVQVASGSVVNMTYTVAHMAKAEPIFVLSSSRYVDDWEGVVTNE